MCKKSFVKLYLSNFYMLPTYKNRKRKRAKKNREREEERERYREKQRVKRDRQEVRTPSASDYEVRN